MITFLFCQLVGISTTIAATYYVDASKGNDENIGDSLHPWKTLDRAYTWYSGEGNKVQEGDTVLFRNGSYGEFRESTDDNPPSKYHFHRTNWVIYKAAPGHTPTFIGSITVKNEDHTSNPFTPGESYLWFEEISIPSGSISLKATNYIKVINCTISAAAVSFKGAIKPWYVADNSRSLNGLDVNYVTIQGCTFNKGYRGIHIDGACGDWEVNNCTIRNMAEVGIMVGIDNFILKNNTIKDIGGSCEGGAGEDLHGSGGIQSGPFQVNEVIIQDTTGATGVYYRASGVNDIYQYKTSATQFQVGYAVRGQNSGAYLVVTSPAGTTGTGIHSGGLYVNRGDGVQIIGNIIETDSQGIALYGDKGAITNLNLSNNLLYSNRAAGLVFIVIEHVESGDVINNTVSSPAYVDFTNTNGYGNCSITNLYNNIFTSVRVNGDKNGKITRIVNHGNNIFGNNPNGTGGPSYPFVANGTELVNYNIDSLFVNAAKNDFNLAPGSIAINFGNPSYGPATDILGRTRVGAPDAGCYEYVNPSKSPPNADAGPDQSGTSGQITLDGSNSSDSDGSIADSNYVWTENGKQIATGVSPTVTLSPGRHIITLTVTDNDNLTDTDTVTVIVELEAGLRGYYKFDEGSGTTASDFAQISTPGRLVNGPTWTAEGEISFAGGNDAVEISPADMKVDGGTIALWAYPEVFSKNKHSLFGHTLSGGNKIQLYCNASGTLVLGLGDNSSLETGIQTLSTQEWYHIALSWDGADYAIYVDGVQKAAGSYGGLSNLQTYADIGNNGNRSSRTEGFNGLIDEVRLYNKPLVADEINDLALVFLPVGDKTVAEGEQLCFPVRTKSGVIVELSDQNLPSIPTFASNTFRWTPDYDDAGTYEVEFSAQHGSGEDFEKVTVTVLDTQQEEPIGYWNFDETNGEIASDSSSSGNNGSLKNGLAWVSGKTNGAIEFSVPNDAVEIQTANFNPKSGTIAMWVNVTGQTLSRHYLFGHASQALTNRIQLYLKYGQLCLGLGDSHETRMNIQQFENQIWYHIALTWSPTTYNIYINGSPKASGTYTGLTEITGHADIGNNGINRDKALNGKIDDVRIYNRALNVNEISQLVIGG
jgi:hypothetical protein